MTVYSDVEFLEFLLIVLSFDTDLIVNVLSPVRLPRNSLSPFYIRFLASIRKVGVHVDPMQRKYTQDFFRESVNRVLKGTLKGSILGLNTDPIKALFHQITNKVKNALDDEGNFLETDETQSSPSSSIDDLVTAAYFSEDDVITAASIQSTVSSTQSSSNSYSDYLTDLFDPASPTDSIENGEEEIEIQRANPQSVLRVPKRGNSAPN